MKPGPNFLSFVYFGEETMVSPVLGACGLSELIKMHKEPQLLPPGDRMGDSH